MPQQFQNYTKREVKQAIRQDITDLQNANQFNIYGLYNLAERREAELQNRIDHVPEDVNKAWKYRFARKKELKKLKKHHEDILGFKAHRKSIDRFARSLDQKKDKDGQLSFNVIEKEYLDNAFDRQDTVTEIYSNNVEIPERVRIFSSIEERCQEILQSRNINTAQLKHKVGIILDEMSGLDEELNILGSYKDTVADDQALDRLMQDHPRVLMMILRQGALQGAYNELISHIANGGVDDINLKKVGEIHKELIMGSVLIGRFSETSKLSYVKTKLKKTDVEKEKAEREAQEEREKAEREAREKAERETREKAEREAREKAEREAREKREKAEREAREKAEREAREKKEKEEAAQKVETAEDYVEKLKEKEREALFARISEKYPIPKELQDYIEQEKEKGKDKEDVQEEKEAKEQEEKKKLLESKKLHIAYNRMAALLGVEDLQQPEKTDGYQDMGSVNEELIGKYKDVWENIWTGDIVRKVVDIQGMDRLFGVQRERKDYLAKISHSTSVKEGDDGKTYNAREYNYNDIVACKLDKTKYFTDKLDKDQVNKAMNIEFATKLANLDFDDQDFAQRFEQLLKPLLGDNYDKLKKKLRDAKKLVNNGKMVLIRKDLYKVTDNIELIDDLMFGDCAFHTSNTDPEYAFRGDKVVDKKEYSKRIAANKEYLLDEWLETNKSLKVSEDFEQVYKAVADYKKEIDSDHWLDASYYDSFEKMVHTIRQWYNKKDKNDEEEKLCRSLCHVFSVNYMRYNVQGIPENFRWKAILDKKIEECQKDDAAAEIYYKLKLKAYKAEKLKNLEEGETEKQINDQYEEECKKIFIDKSNVPLFPHSPCVEDIEQGNLGDCFLLASIAAVVKANPMSIKKIIQDYGTVCMVKFGDKEVYVSKKIARQSCAKKALWVQIMEKAYAKAFGKTTSHLHYAAVKDLVQYVEEKELKQNVEQNEEQEKKQSKKPNQKEIDDQKYNYVREVYFASPECIDIGGSGKEALDNLFGFKKTLQLKQKYAFNRFTDSHIIGKQFKELYEAAIIEDVSQEKSEVKRFIMDKIQKKFLAEIDYRIRGEFNNSYRALTIEDFRDALNDIKNWKSQDVGSVFYWLLSEVKRQFPNENESTIMEYMNQLGESLMKAGIKQDEDSEAVFGYRADLETKTPYYTPKAINWYNKMKVACGKKLAVTCGAKDFSNLFKDYMKRQPTSNGLVQGHEYTVTDVYEKNQHYFVTIRNPWRSDIVEYRRKTKTDGSVEITLEKQNSNEDISRGEFSLELNDFMNAFDEVAVMEDEKKNSNNINSKSK